MICGIWEHNASRNFHRLNYSHFAYCNSFTQLLIQIATNVMPHKKKMTSRSLCGAIKVRPRSSPIILCKASKEDRRKQIYGKGERHKSAWRPKLVRKEARISRKHRRSPRNQTTCKRWTLFWWKMSMNSQEVAIIYRFLFPFAARRRICVGWQNKVTRLQVWKLLLATSKRSSEILSWSIQSRRSKSQLKRKQTCTRRKARILHSTIVTSSIFLLR